MVFSRRQTDQKRKGSDGTPSLILVATGIKLEKMLASIAGTWIMNASVGGSPQAVWPPQDPAPPAEVIFFIGAGDRRFACSPRQRPLGRFRFRQRRHSAATPVLHILPRLPA
jgi:hypothetical protein